MIGRLLATVGVLCALTGAVQAGTLEDVKARGHLLCGVNPGLRGFAIKGCSGAWAGFDVDFCKAVAAAALGDASKGGSVRSRRRSG